MSTSTLLQLLCQLVDYPQMVAFLTPNQTTFIKFLGVSQRIIYYENPSSAFLLTQHVKHRSVNNQQTETIQQVVGIFKASFV